VDRDHDVPPGHHVDRVRLEDPGTGLLGSLDGDQPEVDPGAVAPERCSVGRIRQVDGQAEREIEGLAESFDVLVPPLLDVDPQQAVPREALEDPIVDLDRLVASLGIEEPGADTRGGRLRGQCPRPRRIAATSASALIAVSRTRIETSLTFSERASGDGPILARARRGSMDTRFSLHRLGLVVRPPPKGCVDAGAR
jgi:hypothetical protein